jgi:hypothetical protein
MPDRTLLSSSGIQILSAARCAPSFTCFGETAAACISITLTKGNSIKRNRSRPRR